MSTYYSKTAPSPCSPPFTTSDAAAELPSPPTPAMPHTVAEPVRTWSHSHSPAAAIDAPVRPGLAPSPSGRHLRAPASPHGQLPAAIGAPARPGLAPSPCGRRLRAPHLNLRRSMPLTPPRSTHVTGTWFPSPRPRTTQAGYARRHRVAPPPEQRPPSPPLREPPLPRARSVRRDRGGASTNSCGGRREREGDH